MNALIPVRLRRWALALLLMPAAACMADPDDDLTDEDEDVRLAGAVELGEPQTMLIRYWNGPTMRSSATLIAPNVVLTNAHAAFGGAAGMYVQRGTQTTAGVDPLQVVENLPHPDYQNPGDRNDIALLRLGCNVTDITPAKLNRTPLVDADVGSSITAVGYGPTTWNGTDWGTKRSMGDQLTSHSADWIWVSGVSASPGDSGGSLYGFPSGVIGPPGGGDAGEMLEPVEGGDGGEIEPVEAGAEQVPGGEEAESTEGAGQVIYPQRKLIGVLTFASGRSVRVDAHSAWIDDVVASWTDPSLPPQPAAQTIVESTPPKVCPTYSTVGHYSIPTPEAGVTYTWDANGATVFGSGTSVTVMADSTQAFTLTVTATGPEGCARSFEAVFGPQTSPCWDEPPSGE